MKIEYIWNGSFAGISYGLIVNGEWINLGLDFTVGEEKTRERIVEYLKNEYDMVLTEEEVVFKWGGEL